MAKYQCDYPGCGKFFDSKAKLNRHKARVHGATPSDGTPAPAATPEPGLTIKKPAGNDAPAYHCEECGTAVEKGEAVCPGCGEPLSWESIE